MKTIIVQAPQEILKEVAEFLGKTHNHDYYFIILPIDVKLLDKAEVRKLLVRNK
jgi:hypothetical protein